MSGAEVRLDKVRFSYEQAVMNFDVAFEAGGVTALMGPSGSGKSTLLSLVAGFETPQEGRILIGSQDVTRQPPSKRPLSMVFQENNLFGHLTITQNVGLGRSASLRLSARDRVSIDHALEQVGLGGKGNRLPAALSGGERQRVALARVLVRDRPVLLLDEPFASLGPALRAEMLHLLVDLQSRTGMTVIFVTHQPEDAQRLASAVVFLEDGRVAATGPAERFFSTDGPEAFRRYVGGRG